jgi:predicted DNA-binding protein YlxM (UPF0122 family)
MTTNLRTKSKPPISKPGKKKSLGGLNAQIIESLMKDYVCDDLSFSQLSEKYNVSPAAIKVLAKDYKWKERRAKFGIKIMQKAIDDTKERYHRISSDVAQVFYKQAKYVSRRLSLIKDGDPVPEDLMSYATRLHELIQKDLMKLKDNDKRALPNSVKVESSMPSVIDIANFKPKTKAPEITEEEKEEAIDIKKEIPKIDVDSPPDPLGDN